MAPTSSRSRVCRAAGGVFLAACSLLTAATAAANNSCSDVLGGDWTYQDGVCTSTITSIRDAIMTLSVGVPLELTDDSTAGPLLRTYLRNRVDDWRETGATMVRANDASINYQIYSHGSTKSVVFHEFWQTVGNTPNDAYRTFTFDRGKRLELADLFKPAVDPLTALPPLVKPYLRDALDQAQPPHDPGTYPFTTDKFEPQPDGSGYSSNYRAFAGSS